jgi:hypothetical protein
MRLIQNNFKRAFKIYCFHTKTPASEVRKVVQNALSTRKIPVLLEAEAIALQSGLSPDGRDSNNRMVWIVIDINALTSTLRFNIILMISSSITHRRGVIFVYKQETNTV